MERECILGIIESFCCDNIHVLNITSQRSRILVIITGLYFVTFGCCGYDT